MSAVSDSSFLADLKDQAGYAALLARAAVPEHSVAFMSLMSGGTPFCRQNHLFFKADDWLIGIGYPLKNPPDSGHAQSGLDFADESGWPPAGPAGGSGDFAEALEQALAESRAASCWVIAPEAPESRAGNGRGLESFTVQNRDSLFYLDAGAQIPKSLRGPLERAGRALRVEEGALFSAGHRRLWAEFLGRHASRMAPNARELYARTEAVLLSSRAAGRPDLRLLDASDSSGNLAASLLLDYSPGDFCSYVIGAHSRLNYHPHATDLLFAAMLEQCRREGKRGIHLGLGVNEGIARFKRKWGGREIAPYVMAVRHSAPAAAQGGVRRPGVEAAQGAVLDLETRREITSAVHSFLKAPAGLSKRQIFESLPKQRPFAMIRELRKNGAVSYLCGSAHFFCYSFEFSLRELFEPLHTVIFEGPLDEAFLAAVESRGRSPLAGAARLWPPADFPDERPDERPDKRPERAGLAGGFDSGGAPVLSRGDLARLERVIHGPSGFWARAFDLERPRKTDVRALLSETRPWFAFFSLWAAYLERLGWSESVDLEAWRTAKDMGKTVIGMENLAEQIESLEAVPFARIVDFLRRCDQWPAYVKRNIGAYLDGNVERMAGTSIEFPTRTEMVIDRRDALFFQRMLPFAEAGGCAAFVGTAHLVGMIPMFEREGFSVRPVYPSLILKMRAGLRKLCGLRMF